ncbi:MAG: response regulator [Pirellulales bacterium]|nr:response regulator [Pirellulales bacterium]
MIPSRTILHVDDDPQMTRLVGEQLNNLGYQVHSLNDPADAMKELIGSQHRVIILDIDMPGMNGLDLLQEIKHHDGGIQVIMLTGVVTLTTVLRSFRLGAEACFFKPLTSIDPLQEALEDVFRKIDRWWAALEDLSHRRHSPTGMPA